ncbi:MAG: hypothetical protein ACE5GE_01010 [Phycisphaerae bacterium]
MRKHPIWLLSVLAFVVLAAGTGCEGLITRNARNSAAGFVTGIFAEAVNASIRDGN